MGQVLSLVAEDELRARYERVSREPSDIYEHLPTFVELVREHDASHVIELGTRSGVSTIAWLHGLAATGGRLTSVDLDPRPDIGDWPHWTFVQGDDLDPAIVAALAPADIVFIDTSHLYEHTRSELNIYRHLASKALVLHDTALERPIGAPLRPRFPVRTAVEEFCAAESLPVAFTDRCWGLAIVDLT